MALFDDPETFVLIRKIVKAERDKYQMILDKLDAGNTNPINTTPPNPNPSTEPRKNKPKGRPRSTPSRNEIIQILKSQGPCTEFKIAEFLLSVFQVKVLSHDLTRILRAMETAGDIAFNDDAKWDVAA